LNATNSGKPNNLKMNFYEDIPDGLDFPELLIYMTPYGMKNGGYWLKPGSWNYYGIEREFYSVLDEQYNDCLKDISSFKLNRTLIDFILKREYIHKIIVIICALEDSNCNCTSNLL
jgi:hypothetical protein